MVRLPGRRRELVAKSNASVSWDGDAEWADENEGEAGRELVEATGAPGAAAAGAVDAARANGLGGCWEGWWWCDEAEVLEGGYSGDVGRECAVGRIEASLGRGWGRWAQDDEEREGRGTPSRRSRRARNACPRSSLAFSSSPLTQCTRERASHC